VRDRLGNDVFGTNSWHHGQSLRSVQGGGRVQAEFAIPALNLGIGNYSLTVALHRGDAHVSQNYDWWDRALVFQVTPSELPRGVGSTYLPAVVTLAPAPSP
ncbi:MAG: Wzt carbohydrate-binding domain-containing protein, partial [Candidatus Competibacter sp.]|nr:Wzt carbohydrate-binding domain-containing protein [Candidatus Competibacter sp.]